MIVGLSERPSGGLSLKEAAVLARVTEKSIRHELAAKIVRPLRRAHHHVEFDPRVVFYLALVSSLPVELPKSERRDLFELLTHDHAKHGNWTREASRLVRGGTVPIEVSTSDLGRTVAERLRLFSRGMKRVVATTEILGGEPVFKGTRVSVRHVGLLAKRDVPMPELREDFPSLSEDDIAFARLFVELGRAPGRPRKLKLIRS